MSMGRSCSSLGGAIWSRLQQVCRANFAMHGLHGDLRCESAGSRHLSQRVVRGAASYCLLGVYVLIRLQEVCVRLPAAVGVSQPLCR